MFRWRKKVIIFGLIFGMILELLAGMIAAPKAKAADADPDHPGFYLPDSAIETPTDLTYFEDKDGTLIMTWTHRRDHMISSVPGFIAKTGITRVVNCPRNALGKNGPLTDFGCEDSKATFSATDEEKDDIRTSKYTFHDKGIDVSGLKTGTTLMVQIQIPLRGYSTIAGVTIAGNATQTGLGAGFTDANIDKYIANKIFPYEKSGKDTPKTSSDWVGEALYATKKDQENFKNFMKNFKSGTDSKNLSIIKELDAGHVDPFGIQGFTEEKDGQKIYHPVLTESELAPIYEAYYKNYNGFSKNQDFIDFINAEGKKYNELLQGEKDSCQDLVNRLNSSIAYKKVYAQLGATIGAGGGTLLGLATGGLSLAWTGGLAAGGAVLGSSVEEMVRDSQKDDVDKKLLEITKKSWAAYYSLLYAEFKETKLGLNAYASQGDKLPQEIGINPNKIQIFDYILSEMDRTWNICFQYVSEAINELFGAGECGINLKKNTNKFGEVFFNAFAGALCAGIQMIGEATQWIVEHIYGTIFDA